MTLQQFSNGGTMSTVQITQTLKNAVHPSIKNPKAGKPKTHAEQIVAVLMREGILPFKVPLNTPQAMALGNFLRDVWAAWGKSGSLGPVQFGTGGGTSTPRCWQPEAHTDESLRVEHTRKFLDDWQIQLIGWLIRASEKPGASLTKLGREVYFEEDEKQARAAATVSIQRLSDTLIQYYPKEMAFTEHYNKPRREHRARVLARKHRAQGADDTVRQKIPIAA